MRKLIIVIVAFLLAAAAGGYWWSGQPLSLKQPLIDLQVKSGDGAQQISANAVKAGVEAPSWLLDLWLRIGGRAGNFKAGAYEIKQGDTPRTFRNKLIKGEFAMRKVRIGEGWNIRQVRAALGKADALRHDTQGMSDEQLMEALGRPGHPEGMFFPDTYKYAKYSSDVDLLKLAMRTMDRKLEAAWEGRDPNLPVKNQYDLLKLASIVEKETGHSADRTMVASVFSNRLKIGMRLQTDPTVIYGIGESFDGNLRRKDLETDTPYNSYTRAGLPPTPISMPGAAALSAAANPAESKAQYFVARGDGTSQFSETLTEHNRAVNKYIRGR